ncbi:MAG: hypothetical protein RIM99_10405 [Cyclobacteriaceae bacterium]
MKIKFTALLLSTLFLMNCGDDDDTAASYIGTWVATNIDINSCEDFTQDNFSSVQCTDQSCYKITLTDSLTYEFQRVLDTERGTWNSSGVVLTLCRDDEGEQICDTYIGTLNSSGLRLSEAAEPDGCITSYIMEREVIDETN